MQEHMNQHQEASHHRRPLTIPRISFVVTGFGPFHDVPRNPTTIIVERLVEYLAQKEEQVDETRKIDGGGGGDGDGDGRVKSGSGWEHIENTLNADEDGDGGGVRSSPTPDGVDLPNLSLVTTTVILETSAEAVRTHLDDLYERLSVESKTAKIGKDHSNEEVTGNLRGSEEQKEVQPKRERTPASIVIVLHLGVNCTGTCYELERFGYNEATFRVPDERGYRPHNTCIVQERELGHQLETDLDVNELCREMANIWNDGSHDATDESNQSKVLVSVDPGRYVCNYTYYYSLYRCERENCGISSSAVHANGANSYVTNKMKPSTRFYALFLHVPPFKVEPLERQMMFVTKLMETIRQQVLRMAY